MSSSPGEIRVLAVDDHALIREGIAALIANQKDIRLVAKACNLAMRTLQLLDCAR